MPDPMGGMGKYLGLAITIPISTLVGYGIGYGLDSLFHTGWLKWVFLLVGTAAGIFDLLYELDKDNK